MLSFTATGMPYSTPDGCAPWAWASSDLRRSLGAVRQALRRLALTRRSAAALALASASLGSLTIRPPRTARASAPRRSRPGMPARAWRAPTPAARARDRPHHPAAEFAVAHPLARDVARHVLRYVHVPIHGERRPCRAARRRGARGPGPVPQRGRAALLQRRRGHGLEKARRLRQLQPPVPIARPRP